jgi:hypothetical protein
MPSVLKPLIAEKNVYSILLRMILPPKPTPEKKDNNQNNGKWNDPHTPSHTRTHSPAPRIIMHHFFYF